MQKPKKKNQSVLENLSDIFKEGSDARRTFGKYYSVIAIITILSVLALLALATRG